MLLKLCQPSNEGKRLKERARESKTRNQYSDEFDNLHETIRRKQRQAIQAQGVGCMGQPSTNT